MDVVIFVWFFLKLAKNVKQNSKPKNILQERERRRQHTSYMKSLDSRKKYEEREKKKHQVVLDKLISREKKLISRRKDAEILTELR